MSGNMQATLLRYLNRQTSIATDPPKRLKLMTSQPTRRELLPLFKRNYKKILKRKRNVRRRIKGRVSVCKTTSKIRKIRLFCRRREASTRMQCLIGLGRIT